MRRYFVNLDTNNLQLGRSDTGGIGQSSRGPAGAVELTFGGSEEIQLGFIRTSVQTNLDMGSDISGVLVVKEPSETNSFDGPALTKCLTWTRTTIDGQLWYVGNLPLDRLELGKLLGTSIRTAQEKILVQCVADVSGTLDGTTLKIALDNAGHFCWFDFYTSVGVATVPGAGSFQDTVTIAANATDSAVATALAARVNARTADIGFTATASGANVTLTADSVRLIGQHDALATGFAVQLLAIGGNAGALADADSVTLNAEFSFVVSAARQICKRFTVTLANSLYRDGQLALPSGLTVLNSIEVIVLATGVTGYTGGSTKLDGLATAAGAMPTNQTIWWIHPTDGMRFYRLTAGTDATSSPAVIRPLDYDGSTNARVWKLAPTS